MNDTPDHVQNRYRAMLLERSDEERLKMGLSMLATARALVRAGILATNPQASTPEIRRELFLRFYGSDFDPRTCEKILHTLARWPASPQEQP